MLTPIKYISSESLMNMDCIFEFCLSHIDHNKNCQRFVRDSNVVQHLVNFNVEFDLHILV